VPHLLTDDPFQGCLVRPRILDLLAVAEESELQDGKAQAKDVLFEWIVLSGSALRVL